MPCKQSSTLKKISFEIILFPEAASEPAYTLSALKKLMPDLACFSTRISRKTKSGRNEDYFKIKQDTP